MAKVKEMPAWDELLSAAARLQQLVPGAVLVGGTAAAMHAHHRFSQDADHIVPDLRSRFDEVLKDLESVAGWKTARVNRPVLILGSLDGIETGIRQLIRAVPLEIQTIRLESPGHPAIAFPTPAEILRIKAALVLKRNATRDYVDMAALADHLGKEDSAAAFKKFDDLYPQPNGQSATQQLLVQLALPRPFDLEGTNLKEYKGLDPKWHSFESVAETLSQLAVGILDAKLMEPGPPKGKQHETQPPARADEQASELQAMRKIIADVDEIGPGSEQGKVRFHWIGITDAECQHRLVLIDRYPAASKAALLDQWKSRDPNTFARWEAHGRQPLKPGLAPPTNGRGGMGD